MKYFNQYLNYNPLLMGFVMIFVSLSQKFYLMNKFTYKYLHVYNIQCF